MFTKLKKLSASIGRFLSNDQRSISDFIDLEMNRYGDKHALQCRSGALVTLFRVNGVGSISSDEETKKIQRSLFSLLNKFYSSKNCPVVSWMYSQSSGTVVSDLNEGLKPSKQAAVRLGMDANTLVDDIVQANKGICRTEEIYLAVWTLPQYDKEFVKGKLKTVKKGDDKLKDFFSKVLGDAANPITTNSVTFKQHLQDQSAVSNTLVEAGLLHEMLLQLDALQWMKFKLNDGKVNRHEPFQLYNHEEDKPRFRGGKLKFNLNNGTLEGSPLFLDPLSEQMAESIIVPSADDADGVLYSNGKYHACLEVTTNPRTIVSFNKLLSNTGNIDFRMTFIMSQVDTSGYQSMNQFVNSFLRVNDDCKKSYDQIQFINYTKAEHNASDVNLQILIVISADDRATLFNHREIMNGALVDWGRAKMKLDHNDPVQTLVSSIPGLNYRSYSQGCWISTTQLVRILPSERPATFWDYGMICFRTVDGKPFYYQPHSNLQDYSLSLYIAPPRQGKSLLMNASGIANILSDGASKMGLMVILDVGPTSRGALQLIRYMMLKRFVNSGNPKTVAEIKKYKEYTERIVVEKKWSPDASGWFVNPLETRLGFNFPTQDEKEFLLNFYVTICSNAESGEPIEGTSKLIRELLTETFMRSNSREEMRMFDSTIDKELTKASREILGIDPNDPNKNISMFQLRDMFYQRQKMGLALRAHRFAMPTVSDLVQVLANSKDINEGHDKSTVDAIRSALNTHILNMPYLTKPSTIDFQSAKIISFDMKPVAKAKTNQGKLDTFAQYLLAMHLGMRKFFIEEELSKSAPDLYKKYWLNQFYENSKLKKTLSLDEWHTLSVKGTDNEGNEFSKSQAGAEYIDFLIREAPKFNLSLNIASHRVADFTPTMKSMATNKFFFSGLEEEEIKRIEREMSLTKSEYEMLLAGIHGPRPGVGNEIFYQFKSSKIKGSGGKSQFSARVKYLCSGLMMWALSTDKEDMPHKMKLESEHPEKDWLEALYKTFPDGNMTSLREEIRKEMREQLDSSQEVEGRTNDIEDYLHSEVVKNLGANPRVKQITRNIINKRKTQNRAKVCE